MDDSKLIKLLYNDPCVGMEQLMNQYAGLVYTVVKGQLAKGALVSSDIEDCVADVFSEFYTDLAKYNPDKSSIKSYLCVMARNNAIDILRKQIRRTGGISLDDDTVLQIADSISIDNEITEKELRCEVLSAIKALGEPDAGIIIKKYYLGESSKEIAEELKMNVSNVDTRAYRALNKLKKMLGGKEI